MYYLFVNEMKILLY